MTSGAVKTPLTTATVGPATWVHAAVNRSPSTSVDAAAESVTCVRSSTTRSDPALATGGRLMHSARSATATGKGVLVRLVKRNSSTSQPTSPVF